MLLFYPLLKSCKWIKKFCVYSANDHVLQNFEVFFLLQKKFYLLWSTVLWSESCNTTRVNCYEFIFIYIMAQNWSSFYIMEPMILNISSIFGLLQKWPHRCPESGFFGVYSSAEQGRLKHKSITLPTWWLRCESVFEECLKCVRIFLLHKMASKWYDVDLWLEFT